jgi:phosphotransferase system enzyme I (PtsI)
MALALSGIKVSNGIAIGTTYILHRNEIDVPEYNIPPHMLQAEIARYTFALQVTVEQLRTIRDHIPPHTPPDIIAFIDTHLLMLNDPTLSEGPIRIIKEQLCNAEWALKLERDALVKVFEAMDDLYLQTRKDDIDHLVNQIQRILLNQTEHYRDSGDHLKNQIIIADDLSPADTILMQHHDIAAIVSEQGGPVSHTTILARSLGIPAVVGVHHAQHYLNNNEIVIIDGHAGVVLANPDQTILEHYQKKQKKLHRFHVSLHNIKRAPTQTLDGKQILLHANIELPHEVSSVKQVAADGIGLFRTEFLFMNRKELPDEDEQVKAYLYVVKALKGKPLTIRTLDLGSDKQWGGSPSSVNSTAPRSSALGLRAIRLCLKEPALFKPQLRAILRTSAYGPVRLMIPMLSNVQEFFQVINLLEEAKQDLEMRHLKYDQNMLVGCMIETPAAALLAHSLARQVDFFSIGTNDLIQYTLAIDRIDQEVSYLYEPLHPAVLNLIQMTITAGKKENIPVSLCGEMAGDPRYTRLLLGMGLEELSMLPSTLLEVKNIVLNSDAEQLSTLTKNILKCHSSHEVAEILDQANRHTQ